MESTIESQFVGFDPFVSHETVDHTKKEYVRWHASHKYRRKRLLPSPKRTIDYGDRVVGIGEIRPVTILPADYHDDPEKKVILNDGT
jgi:hypothetical protein